MIEHPSSWVADLPHYSLVPFECISLYKRHLLTLAITLAVEPTYLPAQGRDDSIFNSKERTSHLKKDKPSSRWPGMEQIRD